jgi:predicted PurR-regulated permease PerM
MEPVENQWKSTTRYIVGIGLAIFGIYVIYLSRSVISILILAALIAFLINPLVSFFARKLRLPNSLALFIAYFIGIILILLTPLLLIPPIVNAISYFLNLDYPDLFTKAVAGIQGYLLLLKSNPIQIMGVKIILDSIVDELLVMLSGSGKGLVIPELPSLSAIITSSFTAFSHTSGVAIGMVGSVVSGILGFFIMIISSIYLIKDGGQMRKGLISLVPKNSKQEFEILIDLLRKTWESFFRGQITLMIIIGVIVWLGAWIIGLPGAVSLGVIAGLMEIIPNIGPVIATIPAILVALIQGSTYLPVSNLVFVLIVIGLYIIVQLLENTLIVPNVMGESVHLHPIIIIIGVLVGATTWGILGALLAAPVIASMKIILIFLYRKVIGEDPFENLLTPESNKMPISKVWRFVSKTKNKVLPGNELADNADADEQEKQE